LPASKAVREENMMDRCRPTQAWRRTLGLVATSATVALAVAGLAAPAANAARGVSQRQVSAADASGLFAANQDYCLGQCSDIMAPGNNGNESLAQILENKATGAVPANSDDQATKYDKLLYGYTGLTNAQINDFYNDSASGVQPSQVASTETPHSGTTIIWDKTGIPHIYGKTRADTEFGAGYAAGQDRLWLMDVLRHLAHGQLSSFAGGDASDRSLEQTQWRTSPYSTANLRQQIKVIAHDGSQGAQALKDLNNYVSGINAYISHANASGSDPGEYALTGNTIKPFRDTDVVAIASLVGGLFGTGGGNQLQAAIARQAAIDRYGRKQGLALWNSLWGAHDPATVLTLHDGQRFSYSQTPAKSIDEAVPAAGSVVTQPVVANPTGTAVSSSTPTLPKSELGDSRSSDADLAAARRAASGRSAVSEATRTKDPALKQLAGFGQQGMNALDEKLANPTKGMSNALVVSAKYSQDHHPVAVFGPQTGYFAPQLLMMEQLQGPGISARGAAFAGVNLYVELGRGEDYAWSATSAGQNITDTYALHLCSASGGKVSKNSTHYLYNGHCIAMQRLTVTDAWSPTLADTTGKGSYELVSFRTKYGIVEARGTIKGKPVAFTNLRSTYMHEAASVVGFQEFNNPNYVDSPQTFQQAASHIDYTFNWLYVDSKNTAYFNSGLNPVRPAHVNPNLPVWANSKTQWVGWKPSTWTEKDTRFAQHPHSINQNYYVSWNNKIAQDYGNYPSGNVQRVNLLNSRVKALLRSGKPVTRAMLIKAMESAANANMVGEDVLPEMLKIIDKGSVPAADKTAVAQLSAWAKSGSYAMPTSATSEVYKDADAIKDLDAWYPLFVKAEFKSSMGTKLFDAAQGINGLTQGPVGSPGGSGSFDSAVSHQGSSYQSGWYGYTSKDLSSLLGEKVRAPLPIRFCGGSLSSCRKILLSTLTMAAKDSMADVYPADSDCKAGDQWCAYSIQFDVLGGITLPGISWQNRPTYQQADQFAAHRGQNISDLARGMTASASSSSSGVLGVGAEPAANAVDGNVSTDWQSSAAGTQWLQVDLKKQTTIGHVIVAWGNEYASSYKLEISTNGSSWRTVATSTDGDGQQLLAQFTPTRARYIRLECLVPENSAGYSVAELEAYGL
jgi:acyl-homoserine lactone acylase PvdQ